MKTVGNENDYVLRKNVLDDINELNIIEKPLSTEDIRVQMLGTVLYTKKSEVIPIDWIKHFAETECAEHSIFKYTIERMLEYWEQEQARKSD